MPEIISLAAFAPCTVTENNSKCVGYLFLILSIISIITDPDGEVMMPIFFGYNGIDFLCFASKSPSSSSFFFLNSNIFNKAPSP